MKHRRPHPGTRTQTYTNVHKRASLCSTVAVNTCEHVVLSYQYFTTKQSSNASSSSRESSPQTWCVASVTTTTVVRSSRGKQTNTTKLLPTAGHRPIKEVPCIRCLNHGSLCPWRSSSALAPSTVLFEECASINTSRTRTNHPHDALFRWWKETFWEVSDASSRQRPSRCEAALWVPLCSQPTGTPTIILGSLFPSSPVHCCKSAVISTR